jgi:syntaxin 5
MLANSPLFKSRRRPGEEKQQQQILRDSNTNPLPDSDNNEQESTLSLGIPMLSQQQIQEQQQLAVMEQDRYIENRSTAIESIESTIAELGGIFQQLATMVAEQRETVQR